MSGKFFKRSILISLVIHISLTTFVWQRDVQRKEVEPVSVTFVESSPSTPPTEQKTVNQKTPLKDQKLKQIVEQDRTVNDEIPDKDSYLSQFNQKVIREVRAKETGRFTNKPNIVQKGSSPTKPSRTRQTEKPRTQNFAENNQTEGLAVLETLKPRFEWKNIEQTGKRNGSGRDTASAQTDDYLKDVERGVETMLNTREFIYYSYYNRIKSQLAQYWEPKIKQKIQKIFREGRQIASEHDRITRLLIILNHQGTLTAVKVVSESGVTDLDDAAIEAFREAAPFPNPPNGIVEADGTINIRWDFVLEV